MFTLKELKRKLMVAICFELKRPQPKVAMEDDDAWRGGSVVVAGEEGGVGGFQMPAHYPRFTRAQYEAMEEWRLDNLLKQYGLPCGGSLAEKRESAMGHFLWTS